MEQISCKTCGAPNKVESLSGQWYCEWCGNLIELDDDREKFANIYRKADDAWERKDFDEALRLYEQIVSDDNTQSEAHWGAALCRYGVAYVTDPLHETKMPTCNRVNRTSILEDKNYLAAIKYAGPNARKKYEQRAHEIDRIAQQFLKIVSKEQPYDVFISYKKTGLDGRLTLDSQYARKLYHYLTDKGIKVFFAEETLATVAGSMYEPYIFAALTSAKVMVLMGSCKEHFEAVWVKNEWRRFLALAEQDPSKVLIPAYINCKPEDELPMGLNLVQAMDATGMVFLEDVTAIVKKKMGAAPQAAKAGNLNLLAEKYATKANVDKVVDALDCEPELAAEVLIIHQGKVDAAIRYISSSSDYQKAVWTCAECGTKNTHDVCRNHDCGLTKADAIKVAQMRKEAKRKEEEMRRKEEEQRRKEYERSAAAKRARAEKRAQSAKKFFSVLVVLAILAGVVFGVYSLITKVIMPAIHKNATAESFYSPEILQSYTGTYRANSGDTAVGILTFTDCSQDGNVTGIFEFMLEGNYGKYSVNGVITNRKNNGKIIMDLTPNQWILQPGDYIFLDPITLSFSEDHTTITGNKYNIQLSAGSDTEYDIKTAADLNKLANSSGLFILKNDIDLAGQNWTPIEGFTGTLVGNGHTIRNMNIESSSDNVGFFATMGGMVSNLNFENATVNVSGRHQNVGILCGAQSGIVTNITVSGTVNAPDSSNVSGIVGSYIKETNADTFTYENLHNNANVSGGSYVGGIIGAFINSDYYDTCAVSISNCSSNATITGIDYVAGIVGNLSISSGYGTVYVTDCSITGDITGENYVGGLMGYGQGKIASYIAHSSVAANITAKAYVGCVAGRLLDIDVNNCTNTGSTLNATGYITSENVKYACVGGFVGQGFTISNCTNDVTINYTAGGHFVGGIMGCFVGDRSYDTLNYENLQNNAPVSGGSYVGGIIGSIDNHDYYDSCTVSISSCGSNANITGTDYTAGIIGNLYVSSGHGTVYVSDCSVSGDITGVNYVGGLLGYGQGKITSYITYGNIAANITAKAYVGCVAGKLLDIDVNNCTNTGSTLNATGYVTDENVKYACVGGFVGQGYTISNCTNEVTIKYTAGGKYVGGIMGCFIGDRSYDSLNYENLQNNASVSGGSYVGGIIGSIDNHDYYDSCTVNMVSCVNNATVTGTDYVAGVIGQLEVSKGYGTVYITDCVNSAKVSGSKYVGGIAGYVKCREGSSANGCSNTGTVSGKSYKGNIVGSYENLTIG